MLLVVLDMLDMLDMQSLDMLDMQSLDMLDMLLAVLDMQSLVIGCGGAVNQDCAMVKDTGTTLW